LEPDLASQHEARHGHKAEGGGAEAAAGGAGAGAGGAAGAQQGQLGACHCVRAVPQLITCQSVIGVPQLSACHHASTAPAGCHTPGAAPVHPILRSTHSEV